MSLATARPRLVMVMVSPASTRASSAERWVLASKAPTMEGFVMVVDAVFTKLTLATSKLVV